MTADQDLVRTAARQLHVLRHEVPDDYIRQLRKHPDAYGQHADFSLRCRAGAGYGRVTCYTCDSKIDLGKDPTRKDGGLSIGIGSLGAYIQHCQGSKHTNAKSPASSKEILSSTMKHKTKSQPDQPKSQIRKIAQISVQLSAAASHGAAGKRRSEIYPQEVDRTVKRVKIEPGLEFTQAASNCGIAGDADDDDIISGSDDDSSYGINAWLRDAANAESFDESDTLQGCMRKLGLDETNQKLPGMTVSLFPHQILGVSWMYEQELSAMYSGGILADEMGLGKTVQMIATMMLNRPSDEPNRTLIVCPLAVLDQWRIELETKAESPYNIAMVYHGPNRKRFASQLGLAHTVVTTYNTLALDLPHSAILQSGELPDTLSDEDKTEFGPLLRINWFRVILDEAQYIKNRRARVSSAAARLQSQIRWCLTGTPVINSLADTFSLFRVLRVRPWYEWYLFRRQILANERKQPEFAGAQLQSIFKHWLLRRKKDSKLNGKPLVQLPSKTIETVSLVLSGEEREIYDMVEKRAQAVFNRFLRAGTVLKNYSHAFTLLLRLRQCACHPALIQEGRGNGVVEEILDRQQRREEVKRAKDLVSRHFVEMIKNRLLQTALKRIKSESLDETIQDDCVICNETITDAVVIPCQHAFCKSCALALFDGPNEDGTALSPDQRPCPTCDQPFRKEQTFLRAAFEPCDSDCMSGDDPATEDGISEAESDSESENGYLGSAGRKAKHFVPSTKMKHMMKLLKTWKRQSPDDKTIIICQFVTALDLVAEYLTENDFFVVRYDGSMNLDARENAVKDFMADQGPTVMLLSLKAGGVGLNLTRANRVILLDLGWSQAVEAQAFDRVHRLGQTKEVLVKRLVATNTVEERILELQAHKQSLADHSMGEGSGKALGRLTVRDLAMLFGCDI